MPSFGKASLDDFARLNWERRMDSAFARGGPSAEDAAWLRQQLEEAEAEIQVLAEELRTARAWRARIVRRLTRLEVSHG